MTKNSITDPEKSNFSKNSQDGPLFSAILRPHRSLGVKKFQILILVLGFIFFLIGSVFLYLGAWPIVGFLGLELFLIWGAYRLNYFSAHAYELVKVFPHEVYIRGVSNKGKISEFRFNPRWVQLIIERMEDEKIKQIRLMSSGKGCLVGNFLNPDDLETFAAAFGNAIKTARS